jgi:uncharacterized protein (DUF2345 family)
VKTAAGHQIILDDANERIYVSTAKGATWIELDQDGRVHVFAKDSISMSTGGDFNLTAGGNINMYAAGEVNFQAGAAMKLAACAAMNITGDAGTNLTSGAGFNILASGDLIQTGSNIHLNGPGAAEAECPTTPDIVPAQEPWTRAASKGARGKNWRA